MKPTAVITQLQVIDKILVHLHLPLQPEVLVDGTVLYDVTADAFDDDQDEWDGNAKRHRAPPGESDWVDQRLAIHDQRLAIHDQRARERERARFGIPFSCSFS